MNFNGIVKYCGENIKELTLDGCRFPSNDNFKPVLRNLVTLSLRDVLIDERDCRNLSKNCPNLQQLRTVQSLNNSIKRIYEHDVLECWPSLKTLHIIMQRPYILRSL